MNEIKSKVYYVIATGEVLIVTKEYEGYASEPTKADDMLFYPQLKSYSEEQIDCIELEYGTLATTFNNAKSYSVNLTTKQFEVTYYTQDELNAMQNSTTTDTTNSRISDISSYLSNQTDLISGVENLIIQSELNTIS